MLEERVESLKKVKSRQVIWTEWMQEAVDGLKDNDKVVTYTKCTPFGNILVALHPVNEPQYNNFHSLQSS